MATSITLRSVKGSALTHAEVDGNFTNLQTTADAAVPAGAITSSGLTMATGKLLGRTTASTGAVQEITAGAGLSLSSGQLEVDFTGYLTSSAAAAAYQPLDGDLTAIAALSGTTGFLKKTAADTYTLDTATYLDTTTAASTYQTQSGMSAYLTTSSAASSYQPLDADLTAVAALSTTGLVSRTGAGTFATVTAPSGDLVGTTATQTLTNKTISGASNTLTVDGTNEVGFRIIPQNSQSAAYTLVASDSGKHILHPSSDTTARTFTIPANSSVAYPVGTAITFVNQNGAGVITIAITSDTMRLAGAGTTGSRTLAANGVATAIKITSTEWIISGVGLT